MATQSRTTLKSYFNTGDRPTEGQFGDLIDSSIHLTEDRATTAEVQAGTNNAKFVTPAGAKASVLKFAPNASEMTKGLIQVATIPEAQLGTDNNKAVTPAGAKKAVETFAPVKTVNGIAPVAGNVNLENNIDPGTMRVGIKKYSNTNGSINDIFHFKLPFNTLINNAMYYFKAEGYAYGSLDIIDIVWVGYCYAAGVTKLVNHKTSVVRSTTITAGQYIGSDGHIYLWFKVPSNYFTTFRLDTMRVGNGPLVSGTDVSLIVSPSVNL